jgi:hypothetical protein
MRKKGAPARERESVAALSLLRRQGSIAAPARACEEDAHPDGLGRRRTHETVDRREHGHVVVVVLRRMMLLHPPLLEVGRRGYCDGTGRARGGFACCADPRGCPGAIVHVGRRSRVDVVGALPRGIHRRVDHALT